MSEPSKMDPRRRDPVFPGAWVDPVRDYADYCNAAGHAPLTMRVRTGRLSQLAREHPDPWSVDQDALVRYLAGPGWAPETRRSVRGAIRSFYRWASSTGRIESDPSAGLPAVRVPVGQPKPAPTDVVQAALERANELERLMVLLAAHAGLRRSEVACVRRSDVVDGLLRVKGKGGRVRTVPLTAELEAAIAGRPDGFVFPGQIDGHISPDRVGRVIADLLGEGWTAHTLRHRFATRAYAADRDILAVQQLLGHSSPATTARYAAAPAEAARRAVCAAADVAPTLSVVQPPAGLNPRVLYVAVQATPAPLRIVMWLYAVGLTGREIAAARWADLDTERGQLLTARGIFRLPPECIGAIELANGHSVPLSSGRPLGVGRTTAATDRSADGHLLMLGGYGDWRPIRGVGVGAECVRWMRDHGLIIKLSDFAAIVDQS